MADSNQKYGTELWQALVEAELYVREEAKNELLLERVRQLE